MGSHDESTLALQVALRIDDRDPAQCAAWIESAERVCAKASTRPWLCSRHATVASRRLAKAQEEHEAARTKALRRREEARPRLEARLEAIDQKLRRIDPLFGGIEHGADRAAQNAPLRQRLPSDSRIAELARLHRSRDQILSQLGRDA
ncbi:MULTISPECIES: hypothetical protein [Brachybacterium]|uniref:Uncharacterized protein n=1 Tax=Brachybacterium kimchii TaxID=2942909 RepID=A0ABY4N7M7_9MICO|nr:MULTISPECIES: hypothetical protein [Brachybacterium]MCG7309721.1 hypothetical protein [Brachybacterium sp. ACRRE]UQN30568.1 hypothetical protein M4486_04445 [Brachybacterium kimchii]